jgi:hypothetical protein
MGLILTFFRWCLEKFAVALLLVVLGFGAGALWLHLREGLNLDEWRRDAQRLVGGQRDQTRAARADVVARMERLSGEIAAEKARDKLAEGAIEKLRELESLWDRLVGNPEQQKENARQIERLTERRKALAVHVAELQRELTRATWERDGLDVALGKLEDRLADIEARRSRVITYLERLWEQPVGWAGWALPVKWWIVVFLLSYFAAPAFGRLALYWWVAPWISRGRPVRLAAELGAWPGVGTSGASLDLPLGPGERLWVKERFLQASDEGLARRTRYVLDWRIPATCAATGLVELIELRRAAGEGGELRVTLSRHGDPHTELALVTLPEGARLVLRPSFLAGVVLGEGTRLPLRRRWQFLRWQAWVTLQFRFFEFAGPCRLVLAGSRGIRVERLERRGDGSIPARRTNQDATIGFTPNLDYRPVRAETFWSYHRRQNPLFDDLFSGEGIFLCQQVSMEGEAGRARRFWAGLRGVVLRAFGL